MSVEKFLPVSISIRFAYLEAINNGLSIIFHIITKTIINGITFIVYSFTGLVFPFFKDSITDKRLFNTVKQIIIKIMNK